MSVPKAMRARYDEIAAIIEPFCEEYLDDEYRDLCLYALERLSRKRPSPLQSRRANTWAAGVIYAIGQANWLFDKDSPVYMPARELAAHMGVAQSTAASVAAEIRKWFKIDYFSVEWTLPSRLEDNPMLWLVEVDGFVVDARSLPLELQEECARIGIIPHVPTRPWNEGRKSVPK